MIVGEVRWRDVMDGNSEMNVRRVRGRRDNRCVAMMMPIDRERLADEVGETGKMG